MTEYVIAKASSARCSTTGRSGLDTPDENEAAEKPVRVIETISKQPVQPAQEMTTGNAVLYPNPATDKVIITLQQGLLNDKSLFIYDVSGRACAVKISRRISGNSVELDVSGLANGLYLMSYK